jgi:hypothetical protein
LERSGEDGSEIGDWLLAEAELLATPEEEI